MNILKNHFYLQKLKYFLMLWMIFYTDYALCETYTPYNNPCLQAIKRVSREIHVPIDVLGAVALTETGIKKGTHYMPWPWSLNINGKGFMFKSKEEAIRNALYAVNNGIELMDLGCMQMNWRWHKNKFNNSVVHAFDPYRNVLQAGKYLREHFNKLKNWRLAIGRYHSGTPVFAQRYMAKADINRLQLQKILGISQSQLAWNSPATFPQNSGKVAHVTASRTPQQQAGAIINFEQVNTPLIKLPDAPQMLLRPSRGGLIDFNR